MASQEACLRGGASQAEVSALAARPDGAQLAVGYTDGVVRLFDLQTAESTVVFSGHKSAVTALNYDANGMRLVSGSKVGGVSVRTPAKQSAVACRGGRCTNGTIGPM